MFVFFNSELIHNYVSCDGFGGGGGLKVTVEGENSPKDNQLLLLATAFFANQATYGSGTAVQAGEWNITTNNILFNKCQWAMNNSPVSAEIDISPSVKSLNA